ncbi:MAG: DUF6197 family protein [Leadbetterella sp.]
MNEKEKFMSDSKVLEASEVAEKAADLILEKGMTRGNFQSHGRYCILGACSKVETGRPMNVNSRAPNLTGIIALKFKEIVGYFVAEYNDDLCKNKHDAAKAL